MGTLKKPVTKNGILPNFSGGVAVLPSQKNIGSPSESNV